MHTHTHSHILRRHTSLNEVGAESGAPDHFGACLFALRHGSRVILNIPTPPLPAVINRYQVKTASIYVLSRFHLRDRENFYLCVAEECNHTGVSFTALKTLFFICTSFKKFRRSVYTNLHFPLCICLLAFHTRPIKSDSPLCVRRLKVWL